MISQEEARKKLKALREAERGLVSSAAGAVRVAGKLGRAPMRPLEANESEAFEGAIRKTPIRYE